MSNQLTRRLALLDDDEHRALLGQGLRGIERETLRVDRAGRLARTPHPPALGAALTHPQITTDYAEALLEFITPAENDIGTTLHKLDAIHRYAYTKLGDEMLWSESMPCELPDEADIDIAWYGTSNIGMLKHVYRRGLALRYGKAMQCIAGIHYNYSLPEQMFQLFSNNEGVSEERRSALRDFQSESYIALIRNFRRYSWLLMYLFGASPALSTGFLRGREHQLETLSSDTLYLPYATSLRMSDLGYQNDAQSGLTPHENSLESYVSTLMDAVNRPYKPYEALGTKRDGEWIQLSTNVLQIENEYYSTIRPKRVIRTGERPVQALCQRGVQYVEVRCLDVDPFEAIGISVETGRFMDAFLLFCALDESALINQMESQVHARNFARTVKEGRRPGLTLTRHGEEIALADWANELIGRIAPVAALLDSQHNEDGVHAASLAAQLAKVANPALTPSARVLEEVRALGSSAAFGLRQSELHAASFRDSPLMPAEAALFDEMAAASLAEQRVIEQTQTGSFDDFVAAYNSSTLCGDSD
ncbi:glutamate--cysteine ligase [Massilia antarctica]|uniref:glutamate--cysteine ligase n=1 Tax=Massilia antarctica TaxID=2765360 RepID=UPI0006BB71A8|nr:glutamate--cysteine ligase [Massilia sp. H27-R4]MCY0912074.1 glutamate--cysteine ligase [Massilia sp. H27-R4]CUI06458.1 Glutamate--cysteine ligase [Janthinobacterium sp. CG23_2]CUU30244.1 Glutamate--cysteine ligase [Janthinobacterium sp. CG23_2]